MMQFPRVIAFSFLLSCGKLPAQELIITPDLRFENFNTERNFISDYVGSMTVDSKGYLWASSNGLLRFDGVRFQRYSNFNNQYHGLRNNYNDDLVPDPKGRLWIGNGSGLCYFNDTLGKFIYINKDPLNPILYAYSFLMEDSLMWFASNLGLCKIDLQTLAVTTTSLKGFADPLEIFRLGNNLIGFSTRTGLYIYNTKQDSWKKNEFSYQGSRIRIRQSTTITTVNRPILNAILVSL